MLDNKATASEEKEFLVFVDHRFSRMAEKELMSALPDCKLEPYKVNNDNALNTVFFRLHVEDTQDAVRARIRKSAHSFIDFVMPVDAVISMVGAIERQKIEDVISRVIDEGGYSSFKIEAKKIDRVLDETAKSIEVLLGQDLEKRGYKADLKTPKVMVYVVLLGTSIIVGHVDSGTQKDITLDAFRRANKLGANRLNRAEFKLEEAVEFFGIDLSKHKMGLDIGASPGGWTYYLSLHSIKIIAVDNALLNYKKISNGKRVLVLADESDIPHIQKIIASESIGRNVSVERANDYRAGIDNYDIIHIKANMKQDSRMDLLGRFGRFDILTIDTNTDPSGSAAIANSLVGLLDPKAILIMTIKLPTRAFGKHISTARAELSKNYTEVWLKKLPHNRRELTAYGVFNSL